MKVEQGREAVWAHAKESGLADDIARIAKHFDIKDINIFTPGDGGKLTYLVDRPRKYHRVAVAALPDKSLDEHLKSLRKKK